LLILLDESGSGYKNIITESLKKRELAFSSSIVREIIKNKRTMMRSLKRRKWI